MIAQDKQRVIRVGERVPDFALPAYFPASGDEGQVRLADYLQQLKWVVLVFYPADFTFVCPTELADYALHYETIRNLGAEVIGVSTDTVYTHKAWLETELLLRNVRYPLASDRTGTVSTFFGVYDEATGQALRATFVIDPDGYLRAQQVTWYDVGRNAEETVRQLEAFQFVRSNPGTACPAKWRPGEKVLKPGMDLVGRVHREL